MITYVDSRVVSKLCYNEHKLCKQFEIYVAISLYARNNSDL